MAKGNMFQGKARGKVGDVVFWVANGRQYSRVLNRHPRNPRTDAQQYQRAIMCTITQAYNSGAWIFDHAFQGCAGAGANQSKFVELNSKRLRQFLANDIKQGRWAANSKARFGVPYYSMAVPNELQISDGKYNQTLFTVANGTAQLPLLQSAEVTVADYAKANRIVPDDLYSFVVLSVDTSAWFKSPENGLAFTGIRPTSFKVTRLRVKKNILDNNEVLLTASQLFDIYTTDNTISNLNFITMSSTQSHVITIEEIVGGSNAGCLGVIRSRVNESLRSRSFLTMNDAARQSGVTSAFLLDFWSNANYNPDTDPYTPVRLLVSDTCAEDYTPLWCVQMKNGDVRPFRVPGRGIVTHREGNSGNSFVLMQAGADCSESWQFVYCEDIALVDGCQPVDVSEPKWYSCVYDNVFEEMDGLMGFDLQLPIPARIVISDDNMTSAVLPNQTLEFALQDFTNDFKIELL